MLFVAKRKDPGRLGVYMWTLIRPRFHLLPLGPGLIISDPSFCFIVFARPPASPTSWVLCNGRAGNRTHDGPDRGRIFTSKNCRFVVFFLPCGKPLAHCVFVYFAICPTVARFSLVSLIVESASSHIEYLASISPGTDMFNLRKVGKARRV